MKKPVKKLFAQTYYTFFVSGFMLLMIGAIMPFLSREYGISYSFQGTLLSMNAVGNLLASIALGAMLRVMSRKKSIVIMSSMIFLAFLGIILTNMPFLLAAMFLLAGMGRGSISIVNNSIVNDNAVGQPIYLNLLHMFFAVGAFLSPLIAAVLIGWNFGWKTVVSCGLCLVASMVFLYAVMSIDDSPVKRDEKTKSAGIPYYKDANFFLAAGLLVFYLASETSVNGWVVTYLLDTGRMSESASQLTLSLFWLIMIVGRLTAAFLSTKIRKTTVILSGSAGAAIMFVIFITAPGGILTIAAMIAFSFCFAGIYPTTIAATGTILQGSSDAMAVLLAMAGIGGIVMPQIIGMAAQYINIGFGMGLLVITVFSTVACAAALRVRDRARS